MLTDGLTSLDQAIAVDNGQIDYVLDLADRVLGQSLEEGNFDFAFQAIESFRTMNKASSLGVSKILHGVKNNWDKCENEETFIQQAIRKTGYAQPTIERYIDVWELLSGEYIPEEFRERVSEQTMRQLVKVADTVVSQEYELDHDEWLAVSEAIDDRRTMEVCQTAKGKERNKNHMSIKLDDDGVIVAYQGIDSVVVGRLLIADQNELVQKAIRRITRESGITKRNEY